MKLPPLPPPAPLQPGAMRSRSLAKRGSLFRGRERRVKAVGLGKSDFLAVSDGLIERKALYWEDEGNHAVRMGDWKIVVDNHRPWELYHIVQDCSEQRDLSKEQPDRVQQMAEMYSADAKRASVEPWG